MPRKKSVALTVGQYRLRLVDETTYTADSKARVDGYGAEYRSGEDGGVSAHGVICSYSDVQYSCLLRAAGGPTVIHDHSAAIVGDVCFVAVGDSIFALALPALGLLWCKPVDTATCFGVFHAPKHECLVSHGECEIARVSLEGEIEWVATGRDCFSGGFHVCRDGDHVDVADFGRNRYRIDIRSGKAREGEEVILRVARFPDDLNPVPIYVGDPPEPISCRWLAITRVPSGPPAEPETFVLYLLGVEGEIHELVQCETLQIALDQAHHLSGFQQSDWSSCKIPTRYKDDGSAVDVSAFRDHVGGT